MYIGYYNINYWSDYFIHQQVILKQVNSYHSIKKLQIKNFQFINTFNIYIGLRKIFICNCEK